MSRNILEARATTLRDTMNTERTIVSSVVETCIQICMIMGVYAFMRIDIDFFFGSGRLNGRCQGWGECRFTPNSSH